LGLAAVGGLVALRAGGRGAAVVAAFSVGAAASAGRLCFDAIVQRDAPDANQGRSFARFETRFQLAWVLGAFVPVVIPIPLRAGFWTMAVAAAVVAALYATGRQVHTVELVQRLRERTRR
jgi:hypothetical protein